MYLLNRKRPYLYSDFRNITIDSSSTLDIDTILKIANRQNYLGHINYKIDMKFIDYYSYDSKTIRAVSLFGRDSSSYPIGKFILVKKNNQWIIDDYFGDWRYWDETIRTITSDKIQVIDVSKLQEKRIR